MHIENNNLYNKFYIHFEQQSLDRRKLADNIEQSPQPLALQRCTYNTEALQAEKDQATLQTDHTATEQAEVKAIHYSPESSCIMSLQRYPHLINLNSTIN